VALKIKKKGNGSGSSPYFLRASCTPDLKRRTSLCKGEKGGKIRKGVNNRKIPLTRVTRTEASVQGVTYRNLVNQGLKERATIEGRKGSSRSPSESIFPYGLGGVRLYPSTHHVSRSVVNPGKKKETSAKERGSKGVRGRHHFKRVDRCQKVGEKSPLFT